MQKIGEVPGNITAGTLDFYNDSLYLFGYPWPIIAQLPNLNALYAYSLIENQWRIVETGPIKPEYRAFHSSFLYQDDLYIVYGLLIEASLPLNSTWKFNFPSNQWTLISNTSGQGMVYSDMVQDNEIVYSGCGLSVSLAMNHIFYFNLSQSGLTKNMLSENWDSPKKRKNHCSMVFNNRILIFGGKGDDGTYLNDVWSFDIDLNTWNFIVTTGSTPPARELAGCAANYGSDFVVFGGTSGVTIYNDMYYFDGHQNYWQKLKYEIDQGPSPRYSSCVLFYVSAIIVLGGKNSMNVFDEIWAYDFFSESFALINSNDNLKIQFVGYQCWRDAEINTVMYVLGGMDINYKPSTSFYKVTLLENNSKTATSLLYNTINPIASKTSMVKQGDFIYIAFGSYWENIVFPTIFIFNFKTYEEYLMQFSAEFALYGHTTVHYGDSLYIIGGSSTISRIEVGFIANNELYKLTRSPSDVIYLGCSDGTLEPDCTPCPVGYLFQNSQCEPCPTGTFSTKIALVSYSQCTDCAFGSYTSKTGSTYCIDCPTGSYCPIGSSQPTQRNKQIAYQSRQPVAYSGNTSAINGLVSSLWYGALTILAVIVFISLARREIFKKIKQIDMFVSQHHQELNAPVRHRKTKIGGVFSVFFVLAAGIIVIASVLTYYLDNITEIKSLVPILLLENYVAADIVIVKVYFYVYGDACVQDSMCAPENEVIDQCLVYSSRDISCMMEGTTCIVLIKYTNFSLLSDCTVQILMLEGLASATSMSNNVTSTSSIPNQESSVYLPISTGSDLLVFIGTKPTVVAYEFTPSVIII